MFLSEVAPSAMSNLIKDFGTIASAIFAQVSEVADTIVSTPLLLFTTGFLFLGGCVGIFGRLLSRICLLAGSSPALAGSFPPFSGGFYVSYFQHCAFPFYFPYIFGLVPLCLYACLLHLWSFISSDEGGISCFSFLSLCFGLPCSSLFSTSQRESI